MGDLDTPNIELQPVTLPFGATIFQTRHGQGVSHDAAFLVEILRAELQNTPLRVLELGSGNGIISIMLAHYFPRWHILGIEIQPHLATLAQENAAAAGVSASFVQGDLRHWNQSPFWDVIFANPPYYACQDGRISPVEERAISRHEICCTMADVLDAVRRNLHPETGAAYMLYPASRLVELQKAGKKIDLHTAAEFSLGPKQKEKVLVKLMRKKRC